MSLTISRRARLAVAVGMITVLGGGVGACGAGEDGGEDASLDRPVEMVVAFGPGGGSDQVARSVSSAMADSAGVDIPVVNVPGATGNTGMREMLSGRPGESMAVLIQDTLATVGAGTSAFEMDEVRAVCRLQEIPSALLVQTGEYEDWEDLVATSQESSAPLEVATVGSSSVDDIVLRSAAEEHGAELQAVPYSEPNERYTSLLAGEVDVLYEQLGDVRQYLDSEDIEPLAVVSDERVEAYEDVPTTAEIGLPDEVALPQFRGIITHEDARDDDVEALSQACEEGVATSEFQEFQEQVYAAEDSFQDAEEFQAYLEEHHELIASQLEEYGLGETE